VVVAPVRNGIELDAVRELHLVLLLEPPPLFGPLDVVLSLALARKFEVFACRGCRKLCKLDLGGWRAPSPIETESGRSTGWCGQFLRANTDGSARRGGRGTGSGRNFLLLCLE